jgi:hypothetical protein
LFRESAHVQLLSWLRRRAGRVPRAAQRPRLRLEYLEDRLAPASSITVVQGAAGSGSLDSFLSPTNGTLNPADGGNNPGTLSTGALTQVGPGVDISIGAQASITFNDLGGTLALQTGPGHAATFYTSGPNAAFITFANVNNILSTAGGAIAFNAGTDLTLAGLSSGGGAISGTTANGNLTVGGNESAGAAAVSLTAGGTDMVLTYNAAITGSAVTLTADRMVLDTGTVNAGTRPTNIVTLAPSTSGRPINLGGTGDPTGELRLSQAELNTITAGVLRVGSSAGGTITIGAPVSAPATWNTLSLIANPTNGQITDLSTGGPLAVPNLALQANLVGLVSGGTASRNQISNLAANVSASLTVIDMAALTVGTVDGVQGITATGTLQLYASAPNTELTVNQAITAHSPPPDASAVVSLSFDDMAINAPLNAGLPGDRAPEVDLGPVSHGQAIDVGGADGPGVLGLTAAELDEIHTPGQLGLVNFTANITISAAIDATGHFGSLTLDTQGAIIEGPGGVLTVPSLQLSAQTGVGSGTPLAIQVGALSADVVSGGVAVNNTGAGDLTVPLIWGKQSIPSQGGDPLNRVQGDVTVATDAGLTVSSLVGATGTVTLSGGSAGKGSAISILGPVVGNTATVLGGPGADTITVTATLTTPLMVDGRGGDDDYQVNLGNLGAPVQVNDTGGGSNTVTVNSTPAAATLVVTPAAVTWDGSETVTYSGVQQVTVNGGDAGNTFYVQGTAAGTPVTVNTGNGSNGVIVGSTTTASGVLDDLHAALTVNAGSGLTGLVVNDMGSTVNDAVTVNGAQLTVAKAVGPGAQTFTLNYAASGTLVLNVQTGAGNDAVNVRGTAANATTVVGTGAGDDGVIVGSTSDIGGVVDNLLGPLSVDLGGGTNGLVVNDMGSTTTDGVVLTGTSILLGKQSRQLHVSYAATGGTLFLNVQTGSGDDVVNVQGTAANATTIVGTGAGADTFGVAVTAASGYAQSGPGSLFLDGGAGADTLVVADLTGGGTKKPDPPALPSGALEVDYSGGLASFISYADMEAVT